MHVGWQVFRRKRCSSIPYSFKRGCALERSLGLVSNPSLWDKSDKDTRVRPSRVESVPPYAFRRSRIWRLQLGYCPKNGQGHGSDSDRFPIDPSSTPDRDQGNWVYSPVTPNDCSPGCNHPFPGLWVHEAGKAQILHTGSNQLWYCPYSWGLLLKASAGVARPLMVPLLGYSWRWRGLRDCAFLLYCTNPIHPCLGQWRMKLGDRHPLIHSRGVYS